MSTSQKCLSQLIRSKRFAHDTKSWLALCLWKKESALKISNQIKQPYSGKKPLAMWTTRFWIFYRPHEIALALANGRVDIHNPTIQVDLWSSPSAHLAQARKRKGLQKRKRKTRHYEKYEFLKKYSQKHKDFQKERLDLLKQQHQEGMSLMGKNIV